MDRGQYTRKIGKQLIPHNSILFLMQPKKQHSRFARIETLWATQANKDAAYNMEQYRRDLVQGNRVLANMHKKEAGWDMQWANKRRRLAAHERRLSK